MPGGTGTREMEDWVKFDAATPPMPKFDNAGTLPLPKFGDAATPPMPKFDDDFKMPEPEAEDSEPESPPLLRYDHAKHAVPGMAWSCRGCPCTDRLKQVEGRLESVEERLREVLQWQDRQYDYTEKLWKFNLEQVDYAEQVYHTLKAETTELDQALTRLEQSLTYLTRRVHDKF